MSRPLIHPTAVIEEGAVIGEGVLLGPYSVIGPHVTLLAGAALNAHVVVAGTTTIGEGTVIHAHAVIGGPPQDLKYLGSDTRLIIGKRNMIREGVTINVGTEQGGGETRVGDDNVIMANAHIAHDCMVGNKCIIANNVMLAGHVVIQDGVNLAGGAGVHHFATVGICAYVGGLSRIARDVPPFTIVEGHPSRVRGINVIGLRRHGMQEETIQAVKAAYKLLFKTDDPMSEVVKRVRKEFADVPQVLRLADFLERSTEGRLGRQEEEIGRDLSGGAVDGG